MDKIMKFAKYRPEPEGEVWPSSDFVDWGEWPVCITTEQREYLLADAGLPLYDYRLGMVNRDWQSKSGTTHRRGSLVMAPSTDFAAYRPDQFFFVSVET